MPNTGSGPANAPERPEGRLRECSVEEFLRVNRQNPWRTLLLGSRMRSSVFLDLAAEAATAGEHQWSALRDELESSPGRDRLLLWDIPRLVSTALLACVLEPHRRHFTVVIDLLTQTLDRSTLSSPFAAGPLRLATQIAVMMSAHELFEELARLPTTAPGVAWAGATDFLRPARSLDGGRESEDVSEREQFDRWWASFNAPFTEHGLAPFVVADGSRQTSDDMFGRIMTAEQTAASITPEEQELVSIIVPTFNPQASFLNTLRSLVQQSWSNIEVLVVDDCSETGHEYLQAAAALDPRVRVLRQPSNGGAYRARNRGLAEARGEFVAFQDADDLSHSDRIERQVLPLRNDHTKMASVSQAQRVLSNGVVTYFGYLPHRTNASSLLFRKQPVLRALGQFDDVRKGADSEFTERLRRAFGDDCLVELPIPLSLVQLTLGSLSRSDFTPNWMSGHRWAYLQQFRAAHLRIAAAPTQNWRLGPARPAICSSTPGMRREPAVSHIDYAVLADWSSHLDLPRNGFRRLHELLPDWRGSVGLLNGSRPRFSTYKRDQVSAEVTDSVERGELQWLTWRDETHVGTLIVDDPEFLFGLPSTSDRGITAGVVKIVLDETLRRSARALLPPIDWCAARAREAFGAEIVWLVSSPRLQELLTGQGHTAELIATSAAKRVRIPANPSIGVVLPSPADSAQWDLRRVKSLMPDSDVAHVRLFDEHAAFSREQAEASGFQVVRPAEMTRLEFLRKTDILLPDLFGERLLATESWIRLCGAHRVVAAIPDELETWQQADIISYPPMGSRDLLSVLAVDPAYRKRWDRRPRTAKKRRAHAASAQSRLRFVIFESDKPERCERTRNSIGALAPMSHEADVHLVAGRTIAEIEASGALSGLTPGDRICIVRAGTEFAPTAFERFSFSARDDLMVFTEASETYALNRDIRSVERVVATAKSSPLWAGSTPILVRADTFVAAARRFPWATAPGLAFAAIVAICGTFGVLGEVRSHNTLEDRADSAPKALKGSWYTEFARDWAALLSEIEHIGSTREYLHRVFIYLLSVRMHLNSGHRQRRAFTPEEFADYSESLSRALQFISDEQIWAPGRPAVRVSGAIRQHLLRLKHDTGFAPKVVSESGEPRTVFGDLTIERPRDVRLRIDAMSARNGVLTIHGNYPITSAYPGWDLRLRVGDAVIPLPDRKRYADTTFHGVALGRARTFTAELPFSEIRGRLEFHFSNDDLPSEPLRLMFTRASSKLSELDQAYWAVPGLGVLSAEGRAIAIEAYSPQAHIRAEVRRQRALRRSQDPDNREAARLRLKYFRTLPQYRNRRIWMYADRIVNGGDNGEYAYMYAADQHDEFEKFYVLQSGTALESRFASHGTPYLEFGTDEQRLHFLNASVVFATRLMPSNTFGFQNMQKQFRDLFSAREIYINHGLVVDQLDYVLNSGFTGFDRVCVVSETERHNLLQPNYGYRPEQIEVTGFARYDGLRSSTTRTILLAPTWRTYLHTPQQGDTRAERHRDFTRTPYYRVFDSLINSPRLHAALARNNYRLSFLLHPNVAAQVADFRSNSDRVSVLSGTEDVTYEQLLTTSDLMITDYSGVQFDFAFMSKPVVYYQPPAIPPHYQSGSFDYDRDAFGDVAETEEKLLGLLEELMMRECAIEPKFEQRIERFFAHLDHENSRRIYDVGVRVARDRVGE